ncbi:hypothetical protein ACP6JB_007472 [Aspergillus fumigatus]
MADDNYVYTLYRYVPSIPAAAIMAAVFGLLAMGYLYRIVTHRTYFFVPFIIGLLFETAGYIARIFSHFDPNALGPYIVQTMLILVAPPLFAASIYMTLGRVILKLDAEPASLIRVRWLTKIFVAGDVISFLLQCGGGGYMAAGTLEAMKNGEHIVIAGLAIQLLWFGFFVVVASLFHWRVVRHPKYTISNDLRSQGSGISWSTLMWALYAACVLILVRSIFRVVEFVQGNAGFIMRHEYLLYVFDAVLMALTGIVLGLVFPGSFVSRRSRCADDATRIVAPTMVAFSQLVLLLPIPGALASNCTPESEAPIEATKSFDFLQHMGNTIFNTTGASLDRRDITLRTSQDGVNTVGYYYSLYNEIVLALSGSSHISADLANYFIAI